MIANARFHSRSNPQGLMNAAEIAMHMEQRQHSDVIFELLAKGVRQPGEASHIHPHIEILSLNVGRADMLLAGRTDNSLSLGAKTLRRAVTGCSLGIVAIYLDLLSVIDIIREGIRDGGQIHLMAVRG